MKRKIPPETVLRMYALERQGMGDKEIAKRIGVGSNVVAMSLARVAPDGRVMDSPYGDKQNDPKYFRRGRSIGLLNEIPVLEFLRGRRHA